MRIFSGKWSIVIIEQDFVSPALRAINTIISILLDNFILTGVDPISKTVLAIFQVFAEMTSYSLSKKILTLGPDQLSKDVV